MRCQMPHVHHNLKMSSGLDLVHPSEVLLCPEQNNVLWMKDTTRKFTLPDGLIVDCCASTFSMAKACMLLPQHRGFVVSDLDSECVA